MSHPSTPPTNEPQKLRAGDTWEWDRELSDYPAATWTLTYSMHLRASTSAKITITAGASGDTHQVRLAKAVTAAFGAGVYDWIATVDDGTERFEVDSGSLEILPDLMAESATDHRTFWKKQLDAIEAVLDNRATKGESSYAINGRSISRMTLEELTKHRDRAQMEVNKEERRDRIKNGLGHRGRIKTKFVRAR